MRYFEIAGASPLNEGGVPMITARRWLSYVRRTRLDFGADDLLDLWGDGDAEPQDVLRNVQASLNATMNVFKTVFAGNETVMAYRGLPLGWKGRKINPDGTFSHHEHEWDMDFDIEGWLKAPLDPRQGGVGTSWTWDERAAINDGQARGPTNMVLRAEIPATSVHWLYSFSIFVNDETEKELRLKPRAPLRLLAGRRYDYDADTYVGGWVDLGNKPARA